MNYKSNLLKRIATIFALAVAFFPICALAQSGNTGETYQVSETAGLTQSVNRIGNLISMPVVATRGRSYMERTPLLPSTTYRVGYRFPYDVSSIRLVYGAFECNGSGTELDFSSGVSIGDSSFEYPSGTLFQATYANGASTNINIPLGALATSDPIYVNVPAGSTVWVRTFVIQTGNLFWPANVSSFSDTDGMASGDFALPGSAAPPGVSKAYMYAPVCIIGKPAQQNAPCVGILGDSIAAGKGETTFSFLSGSGYIARSLESANLPYVNLAESGTQASQFANASTFNSNSRLRSLIATSCDYVICDLGTNDLYGNNIVETENDLTTIWKIAASGGARVVQTTIVPRTTSTDMWSTVGGQMPTGIPIAGASDSSPIVIATHGNDNLVNGQIVAISGVGGDTAANGVYYAGAVQQTAFSLYKNAQLTVPVAGNGMYVKSTGFVATAEANRIALNNWLRDPARLKVNGGYLWALVDPCKLCEVNAANQLALNGGYWLTNGTASYPTADGIHPSSAMYVILTKSVATSTFVAF